MCRGFEPRPPPPRSPRSPAPARGWELRKLCPAAPAVDSVQSTGSEPQRSAPLTYLQIHAQVVHCLLQRHTSPPASLKWIEWSDGLARAAMERPAQNLRVSRWTPADRDVRYCRFSGDHFLGVRQQPHRRPRLRCRRHLVLEAFRGLAFHPSHRFAGALPRAESFPVISGVSATCQALFFHSIKMPVKSSLSAC